MLFNSESAREAQMLTGSFIHSTKSTKHLLCGGALVSALGGIGNMPGVIHGQAYSPADNKKQGKEGQNRGESNISANVYYHKT